MLCCFRMRAIFKNYSPPLWIQWFFQSLLMRVQVWCSCLSMISINLLFSISNLNHAHNIHFVVHTIIYNKLLLGKHTYTYARNELLIFSIRGVIPVMHVHRAFSANSYPELRCKSLPRLTDGLQISLSGISFTSEPSMNSDRIQIRHCLMVHFGPHILWVAYINLYIKVCN